MVHILAEERLYIDSHGKKEICEWSQWPGRSQTFKSGSVCFIDCEIKTMQVMPKDTARRQQLFDSVFAQGYLLQEEGLAGDWMQIIAVSKEKIRALYERLRPLSVSAFVPYPVALRAFLKSRSLLAERPLVFLDGLGDEIILTIFEGLRMTKPRRLKFKDQTALAMETRRSMQAFMSGQSPEGSSREFTVAATDRNVLAYLVEQRVCEADHAVAIAEDCPVLEGLKAAKFAMHFHLPEEVVRHKRRVLTVRRLQEMALVLLSVMLGLGGFLFASWSRTHEQKVLQALGQGREEQMSELGRLHQSKFQHIHYRKVAVGLERAYFDFWQGVPAGYEVHEVIMVPAKGRQWNLSALIFPREGSSPLRPYAVRSLKDVKVQQVQVQKTPGQRINLLLGGPHDV